MGEKTEFVLNLSSQLMVIASQMIISFFLTPIVLDKLGAEAYGFVGLVNNFVGCTAVVTTALNSMAGRFVTLSFHRGNHDEARQYYSSVFFANCVLSILVIVGSVVLAVFIQDLVNVSKDLVGDLRITIFLTFLNSGISLLSVVFGIAAFIKNKLYLNSLAQLLSSFVRVILLCGLFLFAAPHMWYYGIAGVFATAVLMAVQIAVSKSVLPEARIRISDYHFSSVREVVKSGVWVSVESVNKLLQTGLDLLISNLFVGGYGMGILSVAKTVPNALLSLSANVASVFYPKLAELYAKQHYDQLKKRFDFAMKFTASLLIVPLVGLVVFGNDFYSLWLGSATQEEIDKIQLLSILTILSLLGSALVEPLYYANTLANKIKGSVLISMCFSVASIVIELALLFFTSLDPLCVIAATSSICLIFRHCLVQPAYTAYVLGYNYWVFYPTLFKECIGGVGVAILFSLVSVTFSIDSWVTFISACAVSAVLGYAFLTISIFDRHELGEIVEAVKSKTRRK